MFGSRSQNSVLYFTLYLSILYSLLSPKVAGLKMNIYFTGTPGTPVLVRFFLVKAADLEVIDSMTSLKVARHWRAEVLESNI